MSVRSCVLVVEDDPSVRQLLRTRLDMAKYDVHLACNGLEALTQIKRLQPDAMILDINMPQMDGFAVLQALRDQREMPRPATMVLTARHAEEDVRRALTLGAKDYLTKPFSEAQLLARVARLLRPPLGRTAPDLVIV